MTKALPKRCYLSKYHLPSKSVQLTFLWLIFLWIISPTQFQDKFPVLVLGDFVLVHLQKHCGLAVEYPSLSPVTQPTLFIQMNLFFFFALGFFIYFFFILFYFFFTFFFFSHPDPPSHLPLHPLPPGPPRAPGPSACLMHPTWAGDLFHP